MRRVWVLLLFAVMNGCGGTSGTVEIPPEQLPFPVARAPMATGSPGVSTSLNVFFVKDDRLLGVERRVDAQVPGVEAAMRALLEGPTAAETATGVATRLPAAASLLNVSVSEGVAIVDLSGELQEPASPEVIALRIAQVVWTLTDIAGINEVAFAIDGEAVAVAGEDGTALDRPARRADFGSLAPPG